jgi:LytS/YehU family sensor histidine kinase
VDASGQQLGESVALPFRIRAPIFLRWWALVLESLLMIALVFLTVRWRKQVRQRKDSMVELGYRNRMQSLEQASLNSSMNRHFIFNSLNAIQFYINREDKRAANKYLSSFAKLIRKNLDSTASAWVSLQDELDRLELYLSLEHMRFKDKFRFAIEVEKGLDASTVKVPAMMLQPFVENSIWHGILPKEESGKVEVKVDRLEGRLRIRIEDDGIGIDQSRALKNGSLPDHESKGMDITHHRLRLYGEMTGTAFDVVGPVQIEENGSILGTRIDLFIPLV